ncbi:L-threonine dehydrogenase [Dongshaea marina]|uniref:L-threonine dehydrogenase n=1 Tax=Dongshaea marina TaxID=2047966 RepID=UPI000D3E74B3|nr:L-threonine dehydrogenase [Dongshaea marina]
MRSSVYYIPPVNYMGSSSLYQAMDALVKYGFKKALIVTDQGISSIGLVDVITEILIQKNIDFVVYDETKPNPTVSNVDNGLKVLIDNHCDCVITLGGGSPHDCGKGIALLATNGGCIKDYEGIDRSKNPQLSLIAINTTAGTASEMTRFCVITDEVRQVKMAIADKNVTPLMSINDPMLMIAKPASLTAATGMDALTHAIEAYLSTLATPVTDASAEKAISLIAENLGRAVKYGDDIVAREQMAYAEFLAGMAFNNAGLGYVHALAHQLGGIYDLPHGVCNAILLPHVQQFNLQVSASRLSKIAQLMGIDTQGMSEQQGADAALEAIRQLGREIGIPVGLKELGVRSDDLSRLADNALNDVCGLTNPRQASHQQLVNIYQSAM